MAKNSAIMAGGWPLAVLICISLSGCSGGSSGLLGIRSATGAPIEGVYRGEFVGRTGAPSACTPKATAVVTLKLGEVRGDLFGPQDPVNALANFYGFVENGGQLKTTVRIGSETMAIDASFSGDSFSGYAESGKCSMRISARRPDAQ